MTAEDMTEQYRITETLKEKNEHLQEIQRRMKAVSDLSGEIFVAREKANARAALHNQLGQVLLMGQHWLEHPESTDAEMVRMTTREMNRYLLREAEELSEDGAEASEPGADLLRMTLAMIKDIGAQAEIIGELPEDPARRTLLAYAIQECASNAVKHAEGDRITVFLEEDGNRLTVRIRNNGRIPESPIVESGGLLSLRQKTEAAGGRMLVESRPGFRLTLILP
jgi:signal transduction histidine kinase